MNMNNHNLSYEQQRLINMYITQYNQTNEHIEQLLDMLDEIRNNISNIISINQPRSSRINRHSRTNNSYINRTINQLFNQRERDFIRYDYNNPIHPNIYNELYTNINRNTNVNNTTNTNIPSQRRRTNLNRFADPNYLTNFLTNFLSTTVPVRPSEQQIHNASRLVRFGDIQNPLSENCPISLERFQSEQMVRQIIPCSHIFCQESFQQWFENNVRCPVCRYDIRTYRLSSSPSSSSPSNILNQEPIVRNNVTVEDVDENSDQEINTPYNVSPDTHIFSNFNVSRNQGSNQIDHVTFDIANSELSDNIVNSLSSQLIQSLLFPQNNNNNDTFMFDASNNVLFYETILRPNRG